MPYVHRRDLDAVIPDESVEDWMRDIVYYWDGLCDQELVERMFTESYQRLKDYEDMGCKFLYDQNGKLKGVPEHSRPFQTQNSLL